MRQLWRDLLTAIFMGMLLPGVLLNGAVMMMESDVQPPEPAVETAVTCPIRVRFGSRVEEMDLNKYLTGVVLAEMPASFEPEALKAQSVAARTYACKAYFTGGKHGDGSVCTDASCCQGYITEEAYLEKGGVLESVQKIAAAVADTTGQVLTYGGALIEATYFACSGGYTEDAAAVWGTDFPYLQSVPSPEEAARYDQSVTFTAEEFQILLERTLQGTPKDWITITTYTEGGGVASIIIGGQTYSGTELRSLLGLRSTAFTVDATVDGLAFSTKGYGHRVGLSQYGAESMAVGGKTYRQILAHYYPGTELQNVRLTDGGEMEWTEPEGDMA